MSNRVQEKHSNGWIFAPFLTSLVVIAVLAGLQWADRAYPLDLSRLEQTSFVVTDKNDKLLRAFAAKDGRWRLPVNSVDVDPRFIKMLLAYEDKRFYSHFGVDVFAMSRAAGQMITSGRVVSGGSTLSMQVVRLLAGPQKRSILVKLKQIVRAVQLERHFSKKQILNAYLQLAPYGGNLEGVRSASLAYFGKEPKVLNTAQAALLVALPQSPESRRPDRYKKRALAARNRVLQRMVGEGVVTPADGERAGAFPLSARRRALPAFAAHLAEKAKIAAKGEPGWKTTIDRDIQARLELLARDKVSKLGRRVTVSILVADHRSGEIVAYLGSGDFFDPSKAGQVDMIPALRSPGSTLKPFIYGLAFEAGVVHPESLIDDVPQNFDGYRPRNFDMKYQGTVSVAHALRRSLNIPAIRLLQSVGPDMLLARFRRANVSAVLPTHTSVGLAIGLGGVGISLRDLVQLYSLIPRGGKAIALRDGVTPVSTKEIQRSLAPVASWYVQKTLSQIKPPSGAKASKNIGFKTGTSYGYRDAWSVGFDGAYVIGVWVGRPDGSSVSRITGISVAAPILFDAFKRVSATPTQLAKAPDGALHLRHRQLPPVLKRFTPRGQMVDLHNRNGKPPEIVFPPTGSKVDVGYGTDDAMPLFVKLQGGKPPFRWLANGKPVERKVLRRRFQWMPDSSGFSTLTVLDAVGRVARVRVFVE